MKETNITDEKIITCLRNELNKPDYKGHLREAEEEDLQIILTQLVNKSMHDDGSNANTLISADDPEVANTYGTVIAEALEAVFSFEMCTPVTIEQLYQWNAKHRKDNPDTKVLLVKSFETSNPEALFNTLTEFQKQKFNPAVILCIRNDTVEELRKYSAQGSVLYNYLCGLRKIIIPGIVQEDIADIICDRLEREGNEVKESFREKLAVHVEAIYPEAVLSKEAFLEDLIVRIRSVHSGKSVDLWRVYDEDDVPYSVKAEALWEKVHDLDIETTSEVDGYYNGNIEDGVSQDNDKENKDSHEEVREKDIKECCVQTDKKESAEDKEIKHDFTDEKKHKVLLMAMSTFPGSEDDKEKKLSINKYIRPKNCESEGFIDDCRGQLEPVAKLMLEKGFSEADFVIISTDATVNNEYTIIESNQDNTDKRKLDRKFTATKYFVKRIKDYLNDKLGYEFNEQDNDQENKIIIIDEKTKKKVIFSIVMIDENNPLIGMGEAVEVIRKIKQSYEKYKSDEDEIELWVDTHGGYRDVSVMMTSLLSLLENEGINHKYIYGIHWPVGKDIFEQNNMFEMFKFVTGMNDFFNFGSASVLKELEEKRNERRKERIANNKSAEIDNQSEEDVKEEEFLDILNKIAQGTQFCDPYLYRTGVGDLIKYKKGLGDDENNEIKNELDIFKESIFSDFGDELFKMKPDSVDLDLAIIERCVEKKLYQQALTFIEALMPRYFSQKEILYYNQSEEQEKMIDDNKNKNSKGYVDNINYVFDANLPDKYLKIDGLKSKEIEDLWSNVMDKKIDKEKNNVQTKIMIEIFSYKYKCENDKYYSEDLETKYEEIYNNRWNRMFNQKKKNGKYHVMLGVKEQVEIEVNSCINEEDNAEERRIADIFLMHKTLKNCRNVFNHGKESKEKEGDFEYRASTKDIENTIRRYISEVKKIQFLAT